MHWRLVIDDALPGALNMARDQAILDLYPLRQQPTLRLYRWSPACVSLGRAQCFERDIDRAACHALNIDVVRRTTGGRAILHEHELTYALIIGLDHPLVARRSVVQSYRAISMALQAGLARLHVHTAFEPEHVQHRRAARMAASAACFDQLAAYEITVHGRKLVGSAQARQHDALLQHGSLLLHADAVRWTQALRLPPTLTPDALRHRMIGLDEVLDTVPPFGTLVDALVTGFEATCGVTLVPGTLTGAEAQCATELVTEHYGNAAWTERR